MAVEGNIYIEKWFVQPERSFYEKELVAVADSADAKAPKYLHFVHSAVNQSKLMRILLCCTWVGEASIIHANVQYLLLPE